MKDGGKHGDSPTINRLWWLQCKDRSREFGELLADLPKATNENLLVGFDSTDDAAVIKLRDDLAIIQTLDFFPTMVTDPYLFGKIAAANALSDVYAMGAKYCQR